MQRLLLLLLMLVPGAFAGDWIPGRAKSPVEVSELVHIRDIRERGRVFAAMVTADVFDLDGHLLVPKGSQAELTIRQVDRHVVALDLDSVTVNGRRYSAVATETESEGVPGTGNFPWRAQPFAAGGTRTADAVGPTADSTQGKSLNVAASSLLTFQLKESIEADVPDEGFQKGGHHYHVR